MTRSKTIFSALLCSVSFISLAANASPSAVTDWHVAPVLSPGTNATPYCALATNYPEAGIIVTHARNKHGTGTMAFDFQDGEFDAGQYYGIDVSFDGITRTFAAEARNNHLLVVDMDEDHPLYAALNAGQDLTIAVQNGGPAVTLAGNSRPFFQLNYCVQALNDDAAAEVVVQRPGTMPSFGLQQPASGLVLTPPAIRPRPLPVAQAEPVQQPKIVQTAAQDGDESRTELENMLDKARSDETKPVRQKLSSISSNDEIDPATIAPVSRNARQSLLFDDPTAANAYVPPKLSDTEKSTDAKDPKSSVKAAEKPAPIAKKTVETSKPVVKAAETVKAAPAPAPVKKEIAKTTPAPAPVIAKPAALPEALPLPDDKAATIAAPKDSLSDSLTNEPLAAPAKPVAAEIKSDSSRTLLATDYAKERATGIPAKSINPADVKADAEAAKVKAAADAKAAKAETKNMVTAPIAAAPKMDITWDEPAPAIAKAADEKPAAITTTNTGKATKDVADTAKDADPKTTIFTGKPAEIKTSAKQADKPKETDDGEALNAPLPQASAVAATDTKTPEPVKEILAAPKAVEKTAKAEPKLDPKATIARAETPVAAVMPAPAMPPAFVEDEPISKNVRGPMKRADEVIAMTFPEDETDDGEALNAPLPQASAVPADVAVPAALLQSKPTGETHFVPPPSAPATAWNVSVTGDANGQGGFCVMKNRFQNQQNLFLSRDADGSATLGIDYGMELLQQNRDYKTTVQLDNLFTEDFIGQARQANLLVVQMGRKDSFFDALRQAKALHVELDGGASTFDVKNIKDSFSSFNTCLVKQGGSALSEATVVSVPAKTPMAALAPAPVPVASAPIAAAAPAPVIAAPSAPIAAAPVAAPVVQNTALPAPKTTAEIKAATTGLNNMVTPKAAPAPVLAAPVVAAPAPVVAPLVVAPVPAPVKEAEAAPAPSAISSTTLTLTPTQINSALKQSNIQGVVRSDGKSYKWGGMIDPIQGELREQRFADGKADLLEAVMRDIDAAEKSCGGQFTSEIGIPEQHGDMESLAAESSCSTNGDVIVQASLYQRVGQMFRVWIQKSSTSNRDILMRQRDRLANVLYQDKNFQ